MEKVLDIPESVVIEAARNLATQGRGENEYTNRVGSRMALEQPILHRFVQTKGNILGMEYSPKSMVGYFLGSCAAFDVISTHLNNQGRIYNITEEDIEMCQRNIADRPLKLSSKRESDGGNLSEVDGSVFLSRLADDSPPYARFLLEIIEDASKIEIATEVSSGAIDVTMTYLYKIESERLGSQFFPQG